MIQKPFHFIHSGAVVATDPKSDEQYGAAYQTLLWAYVCGDPIGGDFCGMEVT